MGMFNDATPLNETRFYTVPAQPGWFVFYWDGTPADYKVFKAPIVAWLVETEFYPNRKLNEKSGLTRTTGRQDFFSMSYPISAGGLDCDRRNPVVLCPDGSVLQLIDGQCWPDVKSYVQSCGDRPEEVEQKAGVEVSAQARHSEVRRDDQQKKTPSW